MIKQIENTRENNQTEKICSFYASDYHFEMISLPYIKNEVKNNRQIIIFTENNLEKTIKELLNRTNLKEEEKQQIVKIDWTENIEEKIEKIKNGKNEEQTILIKGSVEYIERMEKRIKEFNQNTKMIHSYPIQETASKAKDIVKEYDAILNTVGKIDM